jgi:hypothetical protein
VLSAHLGRRCAPTRRRAADAMSMSKKPKPPQGGPKPLTKDDIERTAAELRNLEAEAKQLKAEAFERSLTRDVDLKEAKRVAAESRVTVEEIKSTSAAKLAAQTKEHAAARREDAERVAAFVKRIAEDGKRISALEKELAALKAAELATVQFDEPLAAFTARLGLSAYLATLEEEELDVELLRSMGRQDLATNMAQLGLTPDEISRMADALFGLSS